MKVIKCRPRPLKPHLVLRRGIWTCQGVNGLETHSISWKRALIDTVDAYEIEDGNERPINEN